MTQIKISLILKIVINSNQINLNAIQWIERSDKNQMLKNKKNLINKKKRSDWLNWFWRSFLKNYDSNLKIKNHQN